MPVRRRNETNDSESALAADERARQQPRPIQATCHEIRELDSMVARWSALGAAGKTAAASNHGGRKKKKSTAVTAAERQRFIESRDLLEGASVLLAKYFSGCHQHLVYVLTGNDYSVEQLHRGALTPTDSCALSFLKYASMYGQSESGKCHLALCSVRVDEPRHGRQPAPQRKAGRKFTAAEHAFPFRRFSGITESEFLPLGCLKEEEAEATGLLSDADSDRVVFEKAAIVLFAETADVTSAPLSWLRNPFADAPPDRRSHMFGSLGDVKEFTESDVVSFWKSYRSCPRHLATLVADHPVIAFAVPDKIFQGTRFVAYVSLLLEWRALDAVNAILHQTVRCLPRKPNSWLDLGNEPTTGGDGSRWIPGPDREEGSWIQAVSTLASLHELINKALATSACADAFRGWWIAVASTLLGCRVSAPTATPATTWTKNIVHECMCDDCVAVMKWAVLDSDVEFTFKASQERRRHVVSGLNGNDFEVSTRPIASSAVALVIKKRPGTVTTDIQRGRHATLRALCSTVASLFIADGLHDNAADLHLMRKELEAYARDSTSSVEDMTFPQPPREPPVPIVHR